MGCWFKTCGLSNLHINYSEDVYIVVLERQQVENHCHTNGFWQPVPLPFYGKYNDYGAAEDCAGIGLDFVLESIGQKLSNTIDYEKFFELVRNGLKIKHRYMNAESDINFVMFKTSIVNEIFEHYKIDIFDGTYSYQDLIKQVPLYLIELDRIIMNKINSIIGTNDYGIIPENSLQQYAKPFVDFSDDQIDNPVHYVLREFGINSLFNINRMIVDGIVYKNQNLVSLVIEHLKLAFINHFMYSTRKLWIPMGHEGSQDASDHGYRILVDAITKALDSEKE